jgi:hypothetical protein
MRSRADGLRRRLVGIAVISEGSKWSNGAGTVQGELTKSLRQVAARHLLARRCTSTVSDHSV